MPLRHPRLVIFGALLTVGLASITSAAAAPIAGEKWRLTSSSGPGMQGQVADICLPKRTSATQGPPPPQQKSCTVTNMKRSGTKQTAHMRCDTNGQVMEGEMETLSLGPDHYQTTMHMTMAMGKVDMVSEYQKLEGSCDASVTAAPPAASPTAAMPSGAAGQASSGETPPWAKPGAMEAARAQARQRAEAESPSAAKEEPREEPKDEPKNDAKDKLKSKLRGLIGF